MFILGILAEVVFAALVLYWLAKNIHASGHNLSAAYSTQNKLLQAIEERLQYAQEFNTKVAGSVAMESALYEITKELAKSVEEKEIMNIFKEKIPAIFNLTDAQFVDLQDHGITTDMSIFKIPAGKKILYFAIKDSGRVAKAKMMVMVNQLELFLKRAELYSQLQELAITDGLTGVYVRRYFLERLKEEQSRSKQNNFCVSLLLIDADHFKAYNDTYGHLVGDVVLREVTKILKASLRQIDLCARYGGEEFCIMLPETSKEKAYLVAERIRLNVDHTQIKAVNESFHCTISIGVASYPEDAEQTSSLIDKADKALYIAKAKGRNRSCAFGIKC